jgi:hypothetical protein
MSKDKSANNPQTSSTNARGYIREIQEGMKVLYEEIITGIFHERLGHQVNGYY